MPERLSTGNPALDQMLGGGLLPGTLTVVAGATGIGKTQLGISYLFAGSSQNEPQGAMLDLSARGDSQNHAGYAQRLFDADWRSVAPDTMPSGSGNEWVFDSEVRMPNSLNMLGYSGRRVVRDQMDPDQWNEWQRQLNRSLNKMIGFLYGHLVRGTRRFVIDGIEPSDRPEDSLQMELFEYAYHRVMRQEHDWVARDLLRQDFRYFADQVTAHAYSNSEAACLLLCTTPESMLDQLIDRPLANGDLGALANTLIYMGKIRDGLQMRRGLYIAKHRGSQCDDNVRLFEIDEAGLQLSAG
ncbi:RAD55 family ATPase [Rosistilla oblonga]|uniref:Circadian clock protein KaiC n=1 Tax=Rosistilla oblonga TaxID=2527990 RepID=A0A518IV72_9BACT|nr:ATPase domain-containing protein [Rosistilla oblonga]QDV56965.1 circadian clock protein KaiC [Rosistilla oblonga]